MTPEQIKEYVNEQIRVHIRNHTHSGHESTQVRLFDIAEVIQTVDTAPTAIPKSVYDQVKIYVNGATLRLYWYDATANAWHYVTATA